MPIRVRIALLGVGIVALTLLLFSALVYALAAANAGAEQDHRLKARADQAAAMVRLAEADEFRPYAGVATVDVRDNLDVFITVFGADGAPLTSTGSVGGVVPVLPAEAAAQAAETGGALTSVEPAPGVRLRLAIQPWSRPDLGLDGYIVAGQSARARESTIRGLQVFLIVSAVVTLLVAGGAIWFAVGRALRPLKRVADAADTIARTGDLGRRLPPVRSRDEVRLLTGSFNGMLDRLQQAYRELEDALNSQKRFVADASHELRTPLTTIRTNAGYLLQAGDADPGERAAALRDITAESERMSRLVRDLLTLARADAGHRLEMSPLDLTPAVADVCRQARTLYPVRCIDLVHDESVPLHGNEDALKQLVWILVDNAVKHTNDGGHIRLELVHRMGRAVLHVTDDGRGIPRDDLAHIFDRFYQADAARSDGSAGLGLAIARWIAAEHGGRVLAYNNRTRGATLRVELPAATA